MTTCVKCGSSEFEKNGRYSRCTPCRKAYKAEYIPPTKQPYNPESKRRYYKKNVARLIAAASARYYANKDVKRAYDAKRREEKRHLYRAASKRWSANHPGLKNADTQTRRAKLANRSPRWANKFFIAEIYDLAALRTKATGFRWVVDHVIPLRGRTVSGLHVETNLRVIPETLNLSKSNHFSNEGVK